MSIILVILAIILGYVRKGSLKNLAELKVKFMPLILLSFIIQVGIYLGYAYNIEVIQDFDILLHFISYIVLFAGLMANFDNKWFIIITLGVVLNFIVIFLNGGRMPISYDAALKIGMNGESMDAFLLSRAGTHQKLASGALLWFLSDILPVNFPDFLNFLDNIYSAGDLVLYLGTIGLIQSAMTSQQCEENEEGEEIRDEHEAVEEQVSFDTVHSDNQMDELYIKDFSNAIEETNLKDLEEGKPSVLKEDIAGDTIVFHPEDVNDTQEVEAVEYTTKITLDYEEKQMIESIGEDETQSKDEVVPLHNQEENILEEMSEPTAEVALSDEIRDESVDQEQSIENNQVEEIAKENNEEVEGVPDDSIIDTINQFIIVDGKIKENPNYRNPQVNVFDQIVQDDEIEKRVHKLGEQVEELQMSQIDLQPKEKDRKEDKDKNILQKMSDSQRVDLMRKMRERKENGYTLVEVKVGNKKINFWKKDL